MVLRYHDLCQAPRSLHVRSWAWFFQATRKLIMRPTRLLAAWSRRRAWPLGGALLAMCAPLGLLLLRCAAAWRAPTPSFLVELIARDPLGFVYTTFTPLVVLIWLGYTLGRRDDVLAETSITDPLTQLYNRRHIDARLTEEFLRASRHGTPLALILVDLDHLKEINDYAGHESGDAALVAVADTLRKSCRVTDLAARYGGDEFVILLPSTSAPQALEVAERIRTSLRNRTESKGSGSAITVSIGIADFSVARPDRPASLVEAADAALYVAKEAGRDRAEIAKSPVTSS